MKKTKSKKSKAIRIAVVIIAVLLLAPFPSCYKDGGTVKYRAVLYCVTKEHSLSWDKPGFNIGTIIEILGFEIYNDARFYSYEEERIWRTAE
ncbi:MAG: hypothetical protein K2N72_02485 [Oscillospiraceae bacterium]|nr:hypothetical protein [Oscillospiraceae bacterium]